MKSEQSTGRHRSESSDYEGVADFEAVLNKILESLLRTRNDNGGSLIDSQLDFPTRGVRKRQERFDLIDHFSQNSHPKNVGSIAKVFLTPEMKTRTRKLRRAATVSTPPLDEIGSHDNDKL
jgi:hypothetical protein